MLQSTAPSRIRTGTAKHWGRRGGGLRLAPCGRACVLEYLPPPSPAWAVVGVLLMASGGAP
eukprot:11357458-Heterocapsa_arctica.AAC.1